MWYLSVSSSAEVCSNAIRVEGSPWYIKTTQTDKAGVRREWVLLELCSLLRGPRHVVLTL